MNIYLFFFQIFIPSFENNVDPDQLPSSDQDHINPYHAEYFLYYTPSQFLSN